MLLRVHSIIIIITIIINLIPFLSIYELGNFHPSQTVSVMMMMIIIIIIISINCTWVVTRWQWLFYMYTKYEADY